MIRASSPAIVLLISNEALLPVNDEEEENQGGGLVIDGEQKCQVWLSANREREKLVKGIPVVQK